MKLFYSPFHDFVHKILVVIHEADLQDHVELIPTFPFRNLKREWVEGKYEISALTPLGKVPFLALDNGETLYASQVVAEYLDGFSEQPLYPAVGELRFNALRRLAIGDAIFEFAVQLSMEGWRDERDRRGDLYRWLWPKIGASMEQLNLEAAGWSSFDIGHVGSLQGISYLDAWATGGDDIPENTCSDWRSRWPTLSDWFDVAVQRPSVRSHYQIPFDGDSSIERHQLAVSAVLHARSVRDD
jgi:glutathione S-transferase